MRVLKASTNQVDVANFGIDAQLDYPSYPSISKSELENKYKKLMKRRLEAVSNALVSNFWFKIANRLFIRNKLYKGVEGLLFDELDDADLLK